MMVLVSPLGAIEPAGPCVPGHSPQAPHGRTFKPAGGTTGPDVSTDAELTGEYMDHPSLAAHVVEGIAVWIL